MVRVTHGELPLKKTGTYPTEIVGLKNRDVQDKFLGINVICPRQMIGSILL